MKNKLILHLIFLTFLIGNTNSLETVLFQFTLDEQVQTSKDNEDIIQNESTELKSDKYWNKPFTKLDYYLMQINLMLVQLVQMQKQDLILMLIMNRLKGGK
mgnify:CR=1 FL=1